MRQLAPNIANINNGFGAHNVGVMMGMLGVQYSEPYGSNCFVTISTLVPLVYNSTDASLSVANTALHYSAELHNDIMTNERTCK